MLPRSYAHYNKNTKISCDACHCGFHLFSSLYVAYKTLAEKIPLISNRLKTRSSYATGFQIKFCVSFNLRINNAANELLKKNLTTKGIKRMMNSFSVMSPMLNGTLTSDMINQETYNGMVKTPAMFVTTVSRIAKAACPFKCCTYIM